MDQQTQLTERRKVPVIAPGHTFATITDKISSIVLARPVTNSWLVGFGVSTSR
jgi:molybdopterin-containing oxidoreductase family membrane subunit